MGFFSLSHFVSQFPPTRFPLLTAIGMCHFLPVHHLEWHFARAEGQNITYLWERVRDIRADGTRWWWLTLLGMQLNSFRIYFLRRLLWHDRFLDHGKKHQSYFNPFTPTGIPVSRSNFTFILILRTKGRGPPGVMTNVLTSKWVSSNFNCAITFLLKVYFWY